MLIYISSGNGVDEVCRALWHFCGWLDKHYRFETIHIEHGKCEACYKSILLQSEDERLHRLEGTHLWRAPSPFRPKHKRKNWYFSLQCHNDRDTIQIDHTRIVYQTMRSPGKGGQHVNTTCSGVRALYPPLGLEAVSYDERSQHRNKTVAKERLLHKVQMIAVERAQSDTTRRWKEGKSLERGNPIKVFEENRFREVLA